MGLTPGDGAEGDCSRRLVDNTIIDNYPCDSSIERYIDVIPQHDGNDTLDDDDPDSLSK